jgi:hypothetical protein
MAGPNAATRWGLRFQASYVTVTARREMLALGSVPPSASVSRHPHEFGAHPSGVGDRR